jgi:hypothetical protein
MEFDTPFGPIVLTSAMLFLGYLIVRAIYNHFDSK